MRGLMIVAGLAFAAPALAQQGVPGTSADPLKEICTGFLEQSGQGISGDRNKLCTCLARETKARLTEPEMRAYSSASATGKAPPEAIMQKVMGIAAMCLTQAAQ